MIHISSILSNMHTMNRIKIFNTRKWERSEDRVSYLRNKFFVGNSDGSCACHVTLQRHFIGFGAGTQGTHLTGTNQFTRGISVMNDAVSDEAMDSDRLQSMLVWVQSVSRLILYNYNWCIKTATVLRISTTCWIVCTESSWRISRQSFSISSLYVGFVDVTVAEKILQFRI